MEQQSVFHTQNKALALALMCAGCEMYQEGSTGPVLNIYTKSKLKDLGFGGQGMSIEKAATAAINARKPGVVTFYFRRTDKLNKCIKAWDTACTSIELGTLSDIPDEHVMEVCCVHSQTRKIVNSELIWLVPAVAVSGDAATAKDGDKATIKGHCKAWQVGSNKIKEKLKIK